jgi:hypothetical protein
MGCAASSSRPHRNLSISGDDSNPISGAELMLLLSSAPRRRRWRLVAVRETHFVRRLAGPSSPRARGRGRKERTFRARGRGRGSAGRRGRDARATEVEGGAGSERAAAADRAGRASRRKSGQSEPVEGREEERRGEGARAAAERRGEGARAAERVGSEWGLSEIP